MFENVVVIKLMDTAQIYKYRFISNHSPKLLLNNKFYFFSIEQCVAFNPVKPYCSQSHATFLFPYQFVICGIQIFKSPEIDLIILFYLNLNYKNKWDNSIFVDILKLFYIITTAAGPAYYVLHPKKVLPFAFFLTYHAFKSREGIFFSDKSC